MFHRAHRALRRRFGRPKWAIVELHISTPIFGGQESPEDLIAHLRHHAQVAPRRERAIRQLIANGWTMDRPAIRFDHPRTLLEALATECERSAAGERVTEPLHADGFVDFDIRFRKRYRDSDSAQDDIHALALHDGTDNWGFAWDDQPDGDVAWWDEIDGDQ
jgi:hypothetical protein